MIVTWWGKDTPLYLLFDRLRDFLLVGTGGKQGDDAVDLVVKIAPAGVEALAASFGSVLDLGSRVLTAAFRELQFTRADRMEMLSRLRAQADSLVASVDALSQVEVASAADAAAAVGGVAAGIEAAAAHADDTIVDPSRVLKFTSTLLSAASFVCGVLCVTVDARPCRNALSGQARIQDARAATRDDVLAGFARSVPMPAAPLEFSLRGGSDDLGLGGSSSLLQLSPSTRRDNGEDDELIEPPLPSSAVSSTLSYSAAVRCLVHPGGSSSSEGEEGENESDSDDAAVNTLGKTTKPQSDRTPDRRRRVRARTQLRASSSQRLDGAARAEDVGIRADSSLSSLRATGGERGVGGVYILPASLAPFGFSRSRLPPRYSTAVPRASASALLASSAPAFSTRASLVDYDDDEIDLSFSTSAASAHALPTPIHDSYLIDINASSANAVRQAASGGLAQLRVANIIGGHIGSLAPPPSSATSAASAVSVADIAQR